METKMIRTAGAGILAGLLMLSTSCDKDSSGLTDDVFASFLSTSSDGVSTINEDNMLNALSGTSDLNTGENEILVSAREEEKLARDVYAALAGKWGITVFNRISSAENNHMTAVNSLLKYYGSPDTSINDPGVFTDSNFQSLYNELVLKGSGSVTDALKTGALIEEMDIKDLRNLLAQTSNENITIVFKNLERGSMNHLKAFDRQLKYAGISYVPAYISQEEYNAIIASPFQAGYRYRMNRNGSCLRGN